MADSHSSGDYSDVVSRRKFVSLAGTTGAAAVAGCFGDGGGDGGGDGDERGGENLWFQTTTSSFEIGTINYNPTGGNNIPHSQFGLFAPWAKYLMGTTEFVPYLIQDWEHQDNSMILTMSEEFTWGSSGDSITAEDLALQLRIQEADGDGLWDFIDSVEATGEYELTLNYPSGVRPDFVTTAALDREAAFPPSKWEGEADTDNPGSVTIDVPDPSGPLALTDQAENYHQYEPRNNTDEWEDDPVAGDHYNWAGYRFTNSSSNNAIHQSFIAGEMDGIHSLFVGPDTESQFPDAIEQIQIPGLFGIGLYPDHEDQYFSNRKVREAFYWSLDRNATITNIGESTKVAHPTPVGLTAASIEPTLGDVSNSEDFNTYTYNPDQAESLLSEAGYSPGDISGTLVYPQGWSDWAQACQSTIDQLNQVGWNISGEGRSNGPGTYAPKMQGGDFNICAHQHTQGGLSPLMNIPYFSLDFKLRFNRYSETGTNFFGYHGGTTTLPDGTEVDIDATFEELKTASEAERTDLIRRLARVVNLDIPQFILMEKYEQSFINTQDFEIPENSKHFTGVWPLWWLPMVNQKMEGAGEQATDGLMKAKSN